MISLRKCSSTIAKQVRGYIIITLKTPFCVVDFRLFSRIICVFEFIYVEPTYCQSQKYITYLGYVKRKTKELLHRNRNCFSSMGILKQQVNSTDSQKRRVVGSNSDESCVGLRLSLQFLACTSIFDRLP